MNVVWAVLLVSVLAVSWVAQLLGLPGNWMIVAAAAGYAWWLEPDASLAIGWNTVIALIVIALLGEAVELAASALGVTRVGGSRRGAILAIVGSIVGSLIGMFVGVPIPVVGSLIAAVFFGGVGALVGAMLGEQWVGRDFDSSLEVGKAAFVGRVLGTVGKVVTCSIMVAVVLGAMLF